MSNFPFITNRILQYNLDLSFAHIVDLLTLQESEQYKGREKRLLVESIRKTIIIHTASIIEALLLWKLKQYCKTEKIEMVGDWKYFDIYNLYKINESEEIIAGKRKKEKTDMNRLDFIKITLWCRKYKIINTEEFKKEIDTVRELRNRLHIGSLEEIEKEYSKKDLEFCFSVAKKVKEMVGK